MGRTGFSILALTIAGALASCRPVKPAAEAAPAKISNIDVQSELKMSEMKVQSYGPQGIEWELVAPYGEVFSRKNLMRIRSLSIQLFEKGKKSTDINAKTGLMSTGLKPEQEPNADVALFGVKLEPGDWHLSNDVVMVSTDGSKLTTDWVHYHKKTDVITSTAPVKVERQDSITYGVGMDASADMSRLHIYNETLLIPDKPPGKKL